VKILWQSNSVFAPQGYGIQGKYLLPWLLRMGHEVSIFAFYGIEGGVVDIPVRDPLEPDVSWPIRHYPRAFDPWGNDVISEHMYHSGAELLITLMDTWVLDPETYGSHPWVQWLPIDHDPIPPNVVPRIEKAMRTVPYSRFGERLIRAAGHDCTYIPHGVETSIFRPLEDRAECKRMLGFDDGDFVVGMVGANKGYPSRKAFPEAFEAFAQLRETHPDARLYVHAHVGSHMGGPDLMELAKRYGIEDFVRWPNQYRHLLGLTDVWLAQAYNAMDVLLQPSMAEGFGIPLIEAQACGTPVIVNDCTSMSELVGPGWAVPPLQRWWTPQNSWQWIPDIDGLASALDDAYDARHEQERRDSARAFALAYDWQVVADNYWRPLLEGCAAHLGKPTLREQNRVQVPGHRTMHEVREALERGDVQETADGYLVDAQGKDLVYAE
jgi:glycosyltransferase involved in cell wall biosynthesis